MSNVGESTEFPLDNVEEKIQKLKEDENVRVDISYVSYTPTFPLCLSGGLTGYSLLLVITKCIRSHQHS